MNAIRIWNLIKTKQSTSPNRILKDSGLALAILTALIFIGHISEPTTSHAAYTSFGLAMLIIAIIELGNHTFSEYKNERFAFQWLTLPASVAEKWSANFITSFVIVPVVFLFILSLATVLANLITFFFSWTQAMPVFNPFSAEGWQNLKVYWFVHPLLFFGTIYFRKRPVLKTFGSLALLIISVILFTVWLGNTLFADVLAEVEMLVDGNADERQFILLLQDSFNLSTEEDAARAIERLRLFGQLAFYGYFLFFWGVSYLRYQEWEL